MKNIIKEIQTSYRNKLKTDKEVFEHLLNQIEIHVDKLKNLRENEDIEGRFKREIADMYLLALGLIELEHVDYETIRASANYYLNKVRKKYI